MNSDALVQAIKQGLFEQLQQMLGQAGLKVKLKLCVENAEGGEGGQDQQVMAQLQQMYGQGQGAGGPPQGGMMMGGQG